MLKCEIIKCMNLRDRLAELIKGQIFISIVDKKISITIYCCPTCRYRKELNADLMSEDINKIANIIYNDYRCFIQEKFFIGGSAIYERIY